jgi:hypothetical protein
VLVNPIKTGGVRMRASASLKNWHHEFPMHFSFQDT